MTGINRFDNSLCHKISVPFDKVIPPLVMSLMKATTASVEFGKWFIMSILIDFTTGPYTTF